MSTLTLNLNRGGWGGWGGWGGGIESVRINGVSVLSGLNLEKL